MAQGRLKYEPLPNESDDESMVVPMEIDEEARAVIARDVKREFKRVQKG